MQRSMHLNVALLELKFRCNQGILILNLACTFVPHRGHVHLPDQKAHMHMRLQEMLKRSSLAIDACDTSHRRDATGLKLISRAIIL